MSVIEFSDFSKYYGDFLAVEKLNLNVEKGKIHGFVGKNGAGKSTSIRALLNLIKPSSGSISVNGLDSVTNTKEIKLSLAYLPSEINFKRGLKVKTFFKHMLDILGTHDEKRLNYLIDYFELDTKKDIAELSLGNKKKLMIIFCLLKDADILVFDEPTNGLDPLMQKKFFDLIIAENKKNKTIFLSSHNLIEIEKYCHYVSIIKDGKLVNTVDLAKEQKKLGQVVTYQLSDGEVVKEEVDENLNLLLLRLSKLDLVTLEIRNKTLEEELFRYYE